ncbi:hypothetical protein [Streptococcus loxodontisalivarius]|uniref:Uncharacterized protein n=1 Tax=Streptococcus loxodontisalivarius TaxID=1349415 RepID=A0ABS2PUJ7_9STRE|nr:hypothetical protein [Streptococcus loxodontisalivarius]MBM7643727.1 hypothetical protein [Streptococcus loxodontisalivarius]
MRVFQRQSGYSPETALNYVKPNLPFYSLSSELTPQLRFENNRPTDEITAYKAWFVQEGVEPFEVKFEKQITLPDFLTPITFDNLQACEVRNNVYFKADNLLEA